MWARDCWDFAIYAPFFICLFQNEKGRVRLRDDRQRSGGPPDMELIAVGGSGSFEQPSVANVALIKLAPNYQPQHK